MNHLTPATSRQPTLTQDIMATVLRYKALFVWFAKLAAKIEMARTGPGHCA
jgi:hypothetical protein